MQLKAVIFTVACGIACWLSPPVSADQPLITSHIDGMHRISVPGGVVPLANKMNDRGVLPDRTPVDHIWLLLRRTPSQQQDLAKLERDLQNRASPRFHHWLTPAEFRARFHPAVQDVNKISAWLSKHGFHVNPTVPGDRIIDFSGTAGDIGKTFHTEIHKLER